MRASVFRGHRIAHEELAAIEDEAVGEIVRMQEDAGLPVVTDGEVRRSFWHYDFMGELTGFEMEERAPEEGVAFHGVKLRPVFPDDQGEARLPRRPPDARPLPLSGGGDEGHAEDLHSRPSCVTSGPRRRTSIRRVSGSRRSLRRSRQDLCQGGEGVLRRRLPLSPDGRHLFRLSV